MRKYIGRAIEYYTHNGSKRIATVTKISFHPGLKKPIFEAVSPYGNKVELTRDEIYKFSK